MKQKSNNKKIYFLIFFIFLIINIKNNAFCLGDEEEIDLHPKYHSYRTEKIDPPGTWADTFSNVLSKFLCGFCKDSISSRLDDCTGSSEFRQRTVLYDGQKMSFVNANSAWKRELRTNTETARLVAERVAADSDEACLANYCCCFGYGNPSIYYLNPLDLYYMDDRTLNSRTGVGFTHHYTANYNPILKDPNINFIRINGYPYSGESRLVPRLEALEIMKARHPNVIREFDEIVERKNTVAQREEQEAWDRLHPTGRYVTGWSTSNLAHNQSTTGNPYTFPAFIPD